MKHLTAFLVFLSGEILAFLIFGIVRYVYSQESGWSKIGPVFRGAFERMVIMTGLLQGYPHILIAFGALKIGTRLNNDETKVSNKYFLVGNLISVFLSMLYVIVIRMLRPYDWQ